jgi:hypothetical protein
LAFVSSAFKTRKIKVLCRARAVGVNKPVTGNFRHTANNRTRKHFAVGNKRMKFAALAARVNSGGQSGDKLTVINAAPAKFAPKIFFVDANRDCFKESSQYRACRSFGCV